MSIVANLPITGVEGHYPKLSDGINRRVRVRDQHRQHRYFNNRAENSHQPTRQRERRMQGFKSAGHAQRFLAAYGPIAQHFRPRRPLVSAAEDRQEMTNRFESWAEITGTQRAT